MAYFPRFTHDIFVSYAKADNEPDAQDVRWVSRFIKDLTTALRKRLGTDVSLFFDQADFAPLSAPEHLTEAVVGSAIFLAILLPSYIENKWALAELAAFD